MSVLEVNNVSIRYIKGDFKEIGLKEYILRHIKGDYHVSEFWADRDISFTLEKGEMLGIIGSNGAGKSTLLKTLSGIMEPSAGSILRDGSIAALLELGSGFDGDLTVRENTYLRGAMMGYTRKFMDDTYDQIIEFAELKDFQDYPFKQLSSGMKSRLAFSIASLVRPDILILDEVLSVGDGAFRKKSEEKMREIIEGGATTILVSHSLEQIRAMCSKVLWLHKGEQIAFGDDVQGICDQYQAFLDGDELPELTLRRIEDVSKSQDFVSIAKSGERQREKVVNASCNSNRRFYRSMNEKRSDFICASVLFISIFVMLYFFLGFWKVGLEAPIEYVGGDEFTQYAFTKLAIEGGWNWTNDALGAPYGSHYLDQTSALLQNTEFIITKILGLFTKNVVIVANLQFLLAFALCGLSAFCVLRAIGIERIFALFGGTLFGLSPYILRRGFHHCCLSASYFVPLSVLLCVWSAENSNEKPQGEKAFFNSKRKIAVIIFAILIANNGIGYYPIFTCFFLCVVILFNLVSTRNLSSIKKPMFVICCITIAFCISILPVLIYQITNGSNLSVMQRSPESAERYGLKIIQFFIPLNGHGIPVLQSFIDEYNHTAPLVNENITSYLGIGGIIGFLLLLLYQFVPEKENDLCGSTTLRLFSRLVVCGILFATIGGFSAIFSRVFHALRSYNRISIFIEFICISALCFALQRLFHYKFLKHDRQKKKILTILFIGLIGLCLFDQLPTYGANDSRLESNKSIYESDDKFIKEIEQQLQINDMVFQLPYHAYPEAGAVNNMLDYQHFTGYLHSKNLKWSYGGMKGRATDAWYKYMASLPVDEMIEAIIPYGFRGIYIDTRAYMAANLNILQIQIEEVIDQKPIISGNGTLLFYNLYPYLSSHPELLDERLIEEMDYLVSTGSQKYGIGEVYNFDGTQEDAHRYFISGMSDTETDFAWTDGETVIFDALILEEITGDLELTIHPNRIFNSPQQVVVACDDLILFDETLEDVTPIVIPIPQVCIEENRIKLQMQFPNAISPAEVSNSGDRRKLAIGIASFYIE